MEYLFWIVVAVASLVWVAMGLAIGGRIPYRRLGGLFETIIFLLPLFFLGSFAGLEIAMWLGGGYQSEWLEWSVGVLVVFLAGYGFMSFGLRQKKGMVRPASANWPGLPLVFASFVMAVLVCVIFAQINQTMLIRLSTTEQKLTTAYIAAQPALVDESQNAADLYAKVFAQFSDDMGNGVNNPPFGKRERFDPHEPATVALLKKRAAVIPLLRQGAELPVYRLKGDLIPNWGFSNDRDKILVREQQAGQLLGLDARLQVARGNVSRAVTDIVAMLKMSRQFARRPLLVAALVGIGVDGMANETLQYVLPAVKNPRELDDLDFGQLGSFGPLMEESLRSEELRGLRAFSTFPAIFPRSNSDRFGSWIKPGVMIYRAFFLDSDGYMAAMQRLRAAAAQPYYKTKDESQTDKWHKSEIISSLLLTGLDISLKSSATAQAHDACAKIAIAMTRYRLDHGEMPGRLGELVPKYLEEVPTDPFDGKAIRMVHKNKQWIIYSVGPNGVDDGGVELDQRKKTGDVIFTLRSQ